MTFYDTNLEYCNCCAAPMKGSDHCSECYCERYEEMMLHEHAYDFAKKMRIMLAGIEVSINEC